MAHEFLSIKLNQLDEQMERLHSRIRLSEAAARPQLEEEIAALREECVESEAMLRESLRRSKSDLAGILRGSYGEMERVVRQSRERLRSMDSDDISQEAAAEEKLLLAEYALDLAHQVAQRALLLSMEAIDAQLRQEGSTL